MKNYLEECLVYSRHFWKNWKIFSKLVHGKISGLFLLITQNVKQKFIELIQCLAHFWRGKNLWRKIFNKKMRLTCRHL